MRVPGEIWFDGYEKFELKFLEKFFKIDENKVNKFFEKKRIRIKKRKEKFKREMRYVQLFVLGFWTSIIAFALWRSF